MRTAKKPTIGEVGQRCGAAMERKAVLRKVRVMMKHASRESELDLKDLATWLLSRDKRLPAKQAGKGGK